MAQMVKPMYNKYKNLSSNPFQKEKENCLLDLYFFDPQVTQRDVKFISVCSFCY
jgi:hypothetical protein